MPTIKEVNAAFEKNKGVSFNDKPIYDDTFPTHDGIAKMIFDSNNSTLDSVHRAHVSILDRLNKLEGKVTDNTQSGILEQPEFGMPQGFFQRTIFCYPTHIGSFRIQSRNR